MKRSVEGVVEDCQRPELREIYLKYVDVEGMRVITNNRRIAEQIKNDMEETVVMDGSKVGEFGRVVRERKFEEDRDEWSQNWKRRKIAQLTS